MLVTADVKCYHCGHVSGQIVGPRNGRLRAKDFRPRPGSTRPLPGPGESLRCERCNGPVFLEDVSLGLAGMENSRAFRRGQAA